MNSNEAPGQLILGAFHEVSFHWFSHKKHMGNQPNHQTTTPTNDPVKLEAVGSAELMAKMSPMSCCTFLQSGQIIVQEGKRSSNPTARKDPDIQLWDHDEKWTKGTPKGQKL